MRKRWLSSLLAIVMFPGLSFAWQTGQHVNITKVAADKASVDCPDINRFKPQIVAWSGGIGNTQNMSGFWGTVLGFLGPTKPAEELAHLKDQTALIDDTDSLDGGNFKDIWKGQLFPSYSAGNFTSETPFDEGAYVWMGAAAHLIEDQASPPHGANIFHGPGDQFEGPVLTTFGKKTSPIDNSQIALRSQPYDQLYSACLTETQDYIRTPNFSTTLNGVSTPFWITSRDMAMTYQQSGYSSTLYDGTPSENPSIFGAYGGVLSGKAAPHLDASTGLGTWDADLYRGNTPQVYWAQGYQAADYVYTLLEKVSHSLPPLIKKDTFLTSTTFPSQTNPTILTFHAMENRTQGVTFTATVLKEDSTDTGKKAFSTQTLTLDPDGPELPWEKDVSLTWNGLATDGSRFEDGKYLLDAFLTDEDTNDSPHVQLSFSIDRTAPTIGVFDTRGLVQQDRPTNGDGLMFIVDDTVGSGGKPAKTTSGPGKIEIFKIPPTQTTVPLAVNVSKYPLSHIYSLADLGLSVAGGLLEGRIYVRATDQAGNQSQVASFFLDSTPPTLKIRDARGEVPPGKYSNGAGLQFTVDDTLAPDGSPAKAVTGPGYFEAFRGDAPLDSELIIANVATFSSSHVYTSADTGLVLDTLPNGGVFVRAKDQAGNPITTTFLVDRSSPTITIGNTLTAPFVYPVPASRTTPPPPVIGDKVNLVFADSDSGLSEFSLNRIGGGAIAHGVNLEGSGAQAVTVSLPEAEYEISAEDMMGWKGGGRFKVDYGISAEVQDIDIEGRGFRGIANATWGVKYIKLVKTGPTEPDYFNGVIPDEVVPLQQVTGGGATSVPFHFTGLADGPYLAFGSDGIGANTFIHGATLFDIETGPGPDYKVTAHAFSVSPPFFTPSGKITITPLGGHPISINLSFDNQLAPGGTGAWISPTSVDYPGFTTSPQGSSLAFQIFTSAQFTGGIHVTIGYDPEGLSVERQLGIRLIHLEPSMTNDVTVSVDTVAHEVSGVVTSLAPFIVAVPLPTQGPYLSISTRQVEGRPELAMSSYENSATVLAVDAAQAGLTSAIADLKTSINLIQVSTAYAIGPPSTRFRPDANLTANYSRTRLTELGVSESSLALYVSTTGFSSVSVLPDSALSVSSKAVTAELPKLEPGTTTYVILMGAPVPPVPPDTIPPVTSLGFSGVFSSTPGAAALINDRSSITLTATDAGPGPLKTFFAIDPSSSVLAGGLSSGTSSAFLLYLGPISLIPGSRVVAYGSVDGSGNYEVLHSTKVEVESSATVVTDTVAPTTTLGFNGSTAPVAGAAALILETSSITLSATDQDSGVAHIFYLIDPSSATLAAGLNAATTNFFLVYSGGPGFSLASGRRIIAYGAVDIAGNYEMLQSTVIIVAPAPVVSAFGGLGIGRDFYDTFWAVIGDANSALFAHSDSSGVFIASTTLTDAGVGLPWSVLFDAGGRAYAVGIAEGPLTQAADLAVYKASPAGDAVESRALFDSGYANNDLVFDAKAPGWIVGAAQTSGPADFGVVGERKFTMAIWKFDPAVGTVALTTTTSRAGFDFASGLAVDPDGSLWIVGYSAGPDAPASRGLDLIVRHYASDGHTAIGDPFIRPGYLDGIDGTVTARVYATATAVYVAAPRINATGSYDLAFIRFDKNTGIATIETVWRAAGTIGTFPSAILPQTNGLLVVGGIGANSTTAALWRYGFDGVFTGATTVGAGGARGAVLRGNQLWLSVDGSTAPFRVQNEFAANGDLIDLLPPHTTIVGGDPARVIGDVLYVTSVSSIGFQTVDDKAVLNDGLGVGTTQTFYSVDDGAYNRFASSFTLVAEGTHTVRLYSVDRAGNAETPSVAVVAVDNTGPTAELVASGTSYTIAAVDPVVAGVAVGVGDIFYLVDLDPGSCGDIHDDPGAPPGTCANALYAGPFALGVGTHTVFFQPTDLLGNGINEVVFSSFVTVGSPVASLALSPSSGPIGIPFTITGTGFGTYGGDNTRVKFSGIVAPLSVWNETTISGSVPGLLTGAYAVSVERQNASSVTATSAGTFTVTDLSSAALSAMAGPIGVPFTFTGTGFGPYAGGNSRVLVSGTPAPLSVWNDTTITGSIPGVGPGAKMIVIQRTTSDGGLIESSGFNFTVTVPSVTAVSPSSGPIGAAFTLSGLNFGPYAGGNTEVLIGGATSALSAWNDSQISGTVPGALTPGIYPVVVERFTSDGGLSQSGTAYFQVLGLASSGITPSSGPLGVPFTISGTGFGAYAGGDTRVKFGAATAALSVWNDATISGTVPTLATGAWAVVVERQQGSSVSSVGAGTFTVTAMSVSAIAPSSGPIGTAFTLTGPGFGPYAGGNTLVLIDGATAALSVWNDGQIIGTVPGSLPTGPHALTVTRIASDGGSSVSPAVTFQITGMSVDSIAPASGPIGAPFTITGTQFGTYGGGNTRVKIGVTLAALSAWSDTSISGTVPAVATGTVSVVVERQQGSDVAMSNVSSFTIVAPESGSLTPSSGPIGVPFTITGTGFGPYGGGNTRVVIGGALAPLSAWNDTTISGTIPDLPAGSQPVWIERASGSGVQSSVTSYFLVTVPSVASLAPASAPIGAPFTLTGTSFGAYAGGNTRVKIGGVEAPLSVWNDSQISGTVPGALGPGGYDLVVERVAGTGLSSSATQAFTVVVPVISTISPAFGPTGTVVTLTGTGFGPYGGGQTKVLVGGATVPLSVWNDTTINWTVPAYFADGDYPVVVVREPNGGSVQSSSVAYRVGTGYSGSALRLAAVVPLAQKPDSHFAGDLSLSSTTGGRIDTPAKAAVEIPPNAMSADTEITLKRIRGDGLRARAAEEIKKTAAGEPIQFGPEGTHFTTPVTIELPYDPALTADESVVAIHYYNPLRRAWEALPSEVDKARHVVKAKTDHFSIYQPMGLAPTTVAQDEFYFRDQYAFPNPSRNGALITFRIQPGLSDTVEVRVYDLSGRKIHESSDFTFLGAFDDGNGKGAQNTYDHTWSVGGVGSGVYTYVIKASRSSNKPIVKSGKVGVIK